MKIDEHNFIQQLLLKNEAALMYVIDEYSGLIKAVISKNMSCINEYQEECMNDVLLSIWTNISSYNQEKNSFKNWIAAITKYKSIDYMRKYRKEYLELSYEEQNLSDYEIHKTKKKVLKEINRMNKKKLKWKTAVATACLCLVLGLGTVSVVAGLLPIPESVKNVFGIKSTEQVESAEKMGTAINISSVDKGYKITATGVLRDSRHVCVTYRVEKADGSTLDKKGRKCTNVDFWNFDSNDSWMGAEVDIVNREYSPYYIDCYTIWNYIGEVDKKVEVSLGELRLWFDNEEYESIEVDGQWKFEIPTDIEDSSIDIAEGQTIKFGKNKGTLDELRISPIGYSISVTSDEEVHDNEMIKGIDGQIWLYLKNGEKIQCGGPSGPIDNGDGTWSFREIGTFEKLIPLSSMDKVVFEDYEISIENYLDEN